MLQQLPGPCFTSRWSWFLLRTTRPQRISSNSKRFLSYSSVQLQADSAHLRVPLEDGNIHTVVDSIHQQPMNAMNIILKDILNHDWAESLDTRLQPGFHYLQLIDQVKVKEKDLCTDGYDRFQSPGSEWSRRLWVGGELDFTSNIGMRALTIPSAFQTHYSCENKVISATSRGVGDQERVSVDFKRTYTACHHKAMDHTKWVSMDDASLVETRRLVYMKALSQPLQPRTLKTITVTVNKSPGHTTTFRVSDINLFRFSALTYNAHKIHYDKLYARDIEGYANILVHGPLLVIIALEYLRVKIVDPLIAKLREQQGVDGIRLRSFNYKVFSPAFANDDLKVCIGKGTKDRTYELWIETQDRQLIMRGIAELSLYNLIEVEEALSEMDRCYNHSQRQELF